MAHTKDQVEKAILWRLGAGPRHPRDLRESMLYAGFDGNAVRDALARLLDKDELEMLSDLKVRIKSKP